jgi:hypothetical protein
LSDQAVREAYFLGQRHDESMARLLNRYTILLPRPKTGPHISSVIPCPFALLVQQTSQRVNYSAQQATKEHRSEDETVVINIEILLTQSYPAAIPKPTGSRSGSPVGFQIRSSDFWKDFKVRVFDGEKQLPTDSLPGWLVWLEYDAGDIASDDAQVEVFTTDGQHAVIPFDLARLR